MAKKEITELFTTVRKRPKKEEQGVNPIFAQLDWALANSSLVGDLSVDTTVWSDQKKGQKTRKKTPPKPKEIPPFFPKTLIPLFGQAMDVIYFPSHPITLEVSEVWVSGYLVLDPLRRESRYSEAQRDKIIRGEIPLVIDQQEGVSNLIDSMGYLNPNEGSEFIDKPPSVDWDARLLILPPHLVRGHDASTAKSFKEVFGVLYL
jgi:hypothetical protein